MRRSSVWYQALTGGALAGLLAWVLVERLNPGLEVSWGGLVLGVVLASSWGAVWAGAPLAAVSALRARLGARKRECAVAWSVPVVFTLAAIAFELNARIHPEFLSSTAHRILRQDAVFWLGLGLLAFASRFWLQRAPRPRWLGHALAATLLLVPILRPTTQPIPVWRPAELGAQPLGIPARPLLVVGVAGLDARVLLTHLAGGRHPAFARLLADGAWAATDPYRPYLRRSLWTSLATGGLPHRHGVESRWAWRAPFLFAGAVRLLPWPEQLSQTTLPWGLVRRGDPPPSALPALWERLRASQVPTTVVEWPGIWRPAAGVAEVATTGSPRLEPDFAASLATALAPFAVEREPLLAAIAEDQLRLRAAGRALDDGAADVWVELEVLYEARRHLEPLYASDTGQREVLELVLEWLDAELGRLLDATPPDSLVAVVAPYGLEAPDPYERLLRLLGAGRRWRMTARACPEGALLLYGDGIVAGRRVGVAALPDLAPTLCYLLGLPLARYMEGRVLVDAIEPAYLSAHPLRVVE